MYGMTLSGEAASLIADLPPLRMTFVSRPDYSRELRGPIPMTTGTYGGHSTTQARLHIDGASQVGGPW